MIYVDALQDGRSIGGHAQWCHMMTDGPLSELHTMAQQIGLKLTWFQDRSQFPHYDITPAKRSMAVRLGAVELGTLEMAQRCSKRAWGAFGHAFPEAISRAALAALEAAE